MFDLCSDTESAKTIKQLRDIVDSLSARLRTGGLRSQQSASDVQALYKQINQLESEVNGLHDDLAAPSKLHITMGQYRAEWLQEVAGNNRELGWTEKRIQPQLVLMNTMSKSSRYVAP